ncbi:MULTISPECIES: AEC family transporter [Rhodopseudomonas]|uniref:Transporter n=1 Tax=Rhodopseudomonas palustris TaxID=1076 RepID=A0A0D7F828_RHOPL|nr:MULTISPECIES: AEC family transporter [Rhodopseudomonas]KIZ47872.1 transporter [Rhodopseudomonas palustris]MDF3812577.1 AEC family transporter [Rhodopseudomonas sp. BAL398]WOK17681.1 AEC family transporter [Rhodopseudomonas sp. BAL398]
MIGPIVLALIPIVLLIALGHAMKHRKFLADRFWMQAERLSYFVLLPALFVHGLATANLAGIPIWGLVVALIGSTLVASAVLLLFGHSVAADGPAFTSVFQGGIRFNNYVGITAAVGLIGAHAIPLAAVANAAVVPTVNVLCVIVFAQYGTAKPTLRGMLRGIAFNPLVVGCVIGILLQVTHIGLPPGIEGCVKALGQASLPLGLLCVGAALDWEALGRGLKPTIFASGAKFILMPLATALICFWLKLDREAIIIAVLFQALPTASSSYVMARQLGGDAELMAGIVAFQTILAILAVPAALLVLNVWL